MLDDVRDVRVVALDARRDQTLVQHAPGWADERAALKIFVVARLLADQDDARGSLAFAKDRLRRVEIERTALARGCRLAQRGHREPRGQEITGARGEWFCGMSH